MHTPDEQLMLGLHLPERTREDLERAASIRRENEERRIARLDSMLDGVFANGSRKNRDL